RLARSLADGAGVIAAQRRVQERSLCPQLVGELLAGGQLDAAEDALGVSHRDAGLAGLEVGGASLTGSRVGRVGRAVAARDQPARAVSLRAGVGESARGTVRERIQIVEVAAIFDRAAQGAVGALQADGQRRIESLLDADRGLVLVRRLEARGPVELAVSNDGAGIRVERDRPAIHRLAARATALEELVPGNATGRDRGGALRAGELDDGGRVVVVGLDSG